MTITWDPANKGPSLVLSNGNLTCSNTVADWEQVLATLGRSSGKWYFEVEVISGGVNTTIGINDGTESLETYIGDTLAGWGYMSSSRFYNSAVIYPNPTATYTAGDIIGVAVDLDNGKIWWSKNGVWIPGTAWPSPDPETGVDAPYTNLVAEATYYPAYGPYDATEEATAKFAPLDLTYTPPIGYTAWDPAAVLVSGIVTEEGAPVARTVRAYNRGTGELIDGTVSSAVDGSYSIEVGIVTEVFVIAFDDVAGTVYNAVILDKITPS